MKKITKEEFNMLEQLPKTGRGKTEYSKAIAALGVGDCLLFEEALQDKTKSKVYRSKLWSMIAYYERKEKKEFEAKSTNKGIAIKRVK